MSNINSQGIDATSGQQRPVSPADTFLVKGFISCPGTGTNSERFGSNALAAGLDGTAVGSNSSASGAFGVALGSGAAATNASGGNPGSLAVGSAASAGGAGSVVVGSNGPADNGFDNVIILGTATATASQQFIVGCTGGSNGINNVYFGNGVAAGNNISNVTIQTTGGASNIDNSGTNLFLQSGIPLGAGASNLSLRTGFPLASGTTPQTMGDRFFVSGQPKTLSNTTATTTTFALLSTVTNSSLGCRVDYTVELNDGTNWGSTAGSFYGTAVNKAGVSTAGLVQQIGTNSTNNGGTFTTLTAVGALTISGTSLALQITPSWSVGTPTTTRITYTIVINGSSSVTPQ